MRQSWETMTSNSAGHIILTPTQPVGSGRPQRGSNPGPPDQESRALPTELPRPPHEYGITDLSGENSPHKSRFVHTWSNVDNRLEEEMRQSIRPLFVERKSRDEHIIRKHKSKDMNSGDKRYLVWLLLYDINK